MARQLRLKLFSLLLSLALTAMATTTAFADGEIPPATPEVPVATEDGGLPPVEELPAAVTEEEAAPPAATVPGAPVVEKDPIWCPAGVAPKPNTGGCSASFAQLSDLVVGTVPTKNGTIWIESGEDAQVGGDLVINGDAIWSAAKNYSLTLQGGWNGVAGSKVIDGVSIFDTGISIINWNGAVVINQIVMDNAQNNANTGALYVATTKNIVLSNVTVMNTNYSTTAGIYLTNTASATQATITLKNVTLNNNLSGDGLSAWSDGAITLTNVSANGNKGRVYLDNTTDTVASPITVNTSSFNGSTTNTGLYIVSNGAIKLNQVQASDNNQRGVYADNIAATSAQPVTVTGFLMALRNTNDSGLYILSNGAVTLTNLTVSENGSTGVYVNNTMAVKSQNVTIAGVNVFNDNAGYGLHVVSKGAISASNLSAFSNGSDGVFLSNLSGSKVGVTVSGVNSFNLNSGGGLNISSTGAIKASSLTANQNSGGDGVILDNSTAATPQSVTITGVNAFNDNAGYGLYVMSTGAISASNLSVFSNNSVGAFLDNTYGSSAGVTVSGVNSFNSNGSAGLVISSLGAVKASSLTANLNGSTGVSVNNSSAATPQNVTIAGVNAFYDNSGYGLRVISKGAISASNLSAFSNGVDGVYLNNSTGSKAGVAVSGVNSFNSNSGNGINISSTGAITVSNVTATANATGNGVYLKNDAVGAQSPVTILGYGTFIGNALDGLKVDSHGAVTAKNLTANLNLGNGVAVDTAGVSAPQKVTLSGFNAFLHNGDAGSESGLIIKADGTITVSNLSASNNFAFGASLDNYTNWFNHPNALASFATFGSVTLTGYGNFSNNDGGLYVSSKGNASLSNVSASYNTNGSGLSLAVYGKVTLMCVTANNNENGVSMSINTPLLTIKGLIAVGNTVTHESLLYTTMTRTNCP